MWGRRATAVLAAAAVAALAAGCGGSSRLTKAQYEQRVQADGKALTQVTSAISSNATSLATLKTALANARKEIQKAADDLESLKPPQDAEAANATFVKALRELDADLGKMADAVAKGDIASVMKTIATLGSSQAVKDAQAASADLKKKGYDLGALGG